MISYIKLEMNVCIVYLLALDNAIDEKYKKLQIENKKIN